MDCVNIHEAKTHLSKLLERVRKGEEVLIAKSGRPVAKLVPLDPRQRQPGSAKGKIRIGSDFDDPLPDSVQRGFRGEGG